MGACKLKAGDRIYECRYHQAILTELVTDPELLVQGSGSHYWHWKAKIVQTGEIIEYGITEEAPGYGPRLFRKNMYEVGYALAEPVLPPFDTGKDAEAVVLSVSIDDDVEMLGHVFHGLDDIKRHVEMSLYKNYAHGKADEREPEERCEVHVGEMWMPYPCFDFEDSLYEDRTYQNYILRRRPITQGDMKRLSALPSKGNELRITEELPIDMLPMVYYVGDGDTMLVAVIPSACGDAADRGRGQG